MTTNNKSRTRHRRFLPEARKPLLADDLEHLVLRGVRADGILDVRRGMELLSATMHGELRSTTVNSCGEQLLPSVSLATPASLT